MFLKTRSFQSLFIRSFILLLSGLIFSCSQEDKTPTRPNLILIMSDDMGYSDLGCYGGDINTPNLDFLASEGLQFTQFYNTARCCPTRASLLTGLYPHQAGIGHMTNFSENPYAHDYGLPGYGGVLSKNTVTIAEVLKQAGYRTFMTGKWHLGFQERDQWPLQRGFDKYYGILEGACNYFKPVYPRGITMGNDTISITDPDYYTTDAFTDHAIQFISEDLESEEKTPFFLYLAFNSPHWPLQAPKEDIEKYRGKYMQGWQQLREKKYQRMKELGLVDPEWALSPQDSRDWNSLDEKKKQEMDLRMAIYAAQVDRMDQNVGKLTEYLKNNNLLDNTVIFFIDDNGACAEFDELGSGPAENLETKTGYVLSYGRAWANASNTPYRKYKHWLHEGGISSPLIVHWPDGIKKSADEGLIRQYTFLPDIMATFVDLAGAHYPEEFNGHKIPPMAGESITPLLKGKNEPIHKDPIFWEHEGNKAVRIGDFKLVMDWDAKNDDNWELYNITKDRSEMHDLRAQMPEKAEEMKKLWHEWADSHYVMPWDSIVKIQNKKREEQKP